MGFRDRSPWRGREGKMLNGRESGGGRGKAWFKEEEEEEVMMGKSRGFAVS